MLAGGQGAGDERAGSTVVDAAPAVQVGPSPSAYRITYGVESGPPDDRTLSTDVVSVRRPFGSRLETWNGGSTEGEPDSVQVGELGVLSFDSADSEALIVARPPGPGPSDSRLDATLAAALDAGLVERREVREVLGRRCQVHRSGAPLSAGAFAPATPDEHADTCVDAAGLVLEERYVIDGEPVLRRIASELELDPELTASDFEVGDQTIPVDKGGGSFLEVDPESRPIGEFRELEDPPTAFSLVGRYAVIPGQAEAFADPTRRGTIVASTADVFTSGPDLLVVDQGATLEGIAPFTADPDAELVEVDGVGPMEVLVTPQHLEVRADLGGGRFLRVFGTVDLDVLVDVAEDLRLTEGDGLVYLDRP